jgi:hypothetical protein
VTLGTAALLGLVALIGLNQTTARLESLLRRPLVFGVTLALNLVVGGAILALGLPGYPRVVGLIVAGLLLLHVVQAARARAELLEGDREEEREARRRERQALAQGETP